MAERAFTWRGSGVSSSSSRPGRTGGEAGAADDGPVVSAAGGILWRRGPLGWRVALVRRPRHRDSRGRAEWSLPKGHVEEGESPEAAARREVEEETGWRVALGPPAETITYPIAGPNPAHPRDQEAGDKQVQFWHMHAIARYRGTRDDHASKEVDKVAWLGPRRAVGRLTHREQADLLVDQLEARGAPGRSRPLTIGSGRWRRARLEQALALYRVQRPARVGSAGADEAGELLATSHEALARGDLNGAWEGLFAAQEREVLAWSDADVATRSAEVLEEAGTKLKDHWRGRTISTLLEWVTKEKADASVSPLSSDEKRRRLASALRLRNEGFSNNYRRLDHLRGQLALLAGVSVLVVAALAILLAAEVVPLDAKGDPSSDQVLGVALFGALGGSFSGALSLLRAGPKAIPQTLAEGWTTLMRPVIGAVGALAAFAFLVAGVLGIDGAEAAYAVAFAAGFSERLVSKAAETLAG